MGEPGEATPSRRNGPSSTGIPPWTVKVEWMILFVFTLNSLVSVLRPARGYSLADPDSDVVQLCTFGINQAFTDKP